MSQAFTILAIIGFSLAAVLVIVAVVMFFKLNIKQVHDDLTGKTATRSIAEIRARAKTRKRTVSEAGKKLGWDSSEPIKIPSGPLKSYATDKVTADIGTEEHATTLLAEDREGEQETTVLSGMHDEGGEEGTTILSGVRIEVIEEETTILSNGHIIEIEEETTVLIGSFEEDSLSTEEPENSTDSEEEEQTTVLSGKKPSKFASGAALLIVASLAFAFGPGAIEAQGAITTSQGKPAHALQKMRVEGTRYSQGEGTIPGGSAGEDITGGEEVANGAPASGTTASGAAAGEAWSASLLAPLAEEDETAPVFGAITFDPDNPVLEGVLYAADKLTLIVEVSDLVSDLDPDEPVSGIDPSKTIVTVDGEDYPSDKVFYEPENLEHPEHPERLLIEFEALEGLVVSHSLSNISITIEDAAGNEAQSGPLSNHDIKGKDLEGEEADIDGFIVSAVSADVTLSYDNNTSYNGDYYNAQRTGVVRISNARFGTLMNRASYKDRVIVTITEQSSGVIKEVPYKDFVPDPLALDGQTWIYEHTFDTNGHYTVNVLFKPPFNKSVRITDEFYLDTVAPTINTATLAPTAPVVWDWIATKDEVKLIFDVSDDFTGIDASTVLATIAGVTVPATYNSSEGTLTLSFAADNERILLDGIALTVYDMAYNECVLTDLRTLLGSSVNANTVGFIADSEAPDIAVVYDNATQQNARYYNAPRTATVTITESTLDLIKANDPNRPVVTITRDGSKAYLKAQDFENPNGDGHTWITHYTFNTDGDYQVEAALTDIAGNTSTTFSDAFTIDLSKPSLLLTFDNNDAQSGMYYKAPRTATIRIIERNFSESLTSVTVVAQDAAGNGMAAPGISGWREVQPGTWETTVPFSQELHYSLTVNCTDLAGNVAEEAKEPEFVIDMTAPVVRVERVENNTAYANEIAPLVYFEDLNFEPYRTEVAITGSNQKETTYFRSDEALTTTSRTLTYEDFSYELRYDDVYTLTATIEDKAGNTAEQTVVFSVNRFGSNYEFSVKTQPLIGTYLQEPQEIVVIETNVSGLESSGARLSRNDSIGTLTNGEDYTTTTLGNQADWSRYEYVFPAELFADDGYYRILLSSNDLAGNYSENLMMGKNVTRDDAFEVVFAVDGTSPVASMGGISDGSTFFSPSQLIDVYAGDNMEMEEVILSINEEPVQTWLGDDALEQGALAYELLASDVFNTVSLEVTDRAGNTVVIEASDVLVTNDLFRYVVNTPVILYPIIAALSVLVALAVVLSVRLILKKRAEQAPEEEGEVG